MRSASSSMKDCALVYSASNLACASKKKGPVMFQWHHRRIWQCTWQVVNMVFKPSTCDALRSLSRPRLLVTDLARLPFGPFDMLFPMPHRYHRGCR